MATATATLQVVDGSDITARCVVVKIKAHKLGNSRKVKSSQIEVDADKDQLSVSKKLFNSKEFLSIGNLDGEIRRHVMCLALPFETGVHLVPWELVEKLDADLKAFQVKRQELVDTFIEAYPRLVPKAEGALRALYNPMEYYSDIDYVRGEFSFTWQFASYGLPAGLKELNRKIWNEERSKAASSMREAGEEIRQALRQALLELVACMRDRLDTPEGKPRIFAPATKNLLGYLSTFDFRNVADDDELKVLVDQAKGLLSGVTVDALKDVEEVRLKVRAGVAGIADKLGGMVIEKPTRKIRLED